MSPLRTAPITLTRKRRRRVRSRHHPSHSAEAEDDLWQAWSEDSADLSEGVAEAELTAREIALMSSEIDKILAEAKLAPTDTSAEEQLTVATQAQPPPLPFLKPQKKVRRGKITQMRAADPFQELSGRDLPAPLPRQRNGQKTELALEPGRAPVMSWEPVQATALDDDLNQLLAFNRPSDIKAVAQVPGPSRITASSARSQEGSMTERTPAQVRLRRATSPNRSSAPPATSALAVDDRDDRGCPWCTSGLTPTFPAFQAGLICDDCKFTCTGCGRRSPDVRFTSYCVDCNRPIRPTRETCRICQDVYAHRLHEQDDPYCNCQKADLPRGRRSSKQKEQVPFVYTTCTSRSSPVRVPTKLKTGTSRSNARNVWTASDSTMADYIDTDRSEVTEPAEKKASGRPRSALPEPESASTDCQTKYNQTPRFSPSTCHECKAELCPACGCPGQTNPCTANVWYVCPPEPNPCCCADVPYSAGEMFAPQALLPTAAHSCGSQGSFIQPSCCATDCTQPPPDSLAGTSFRREQMWTEDGTVRKIVIEQIEQPDGFRTGAESVLSATSPSVCRHSQASIPSQFSSAPASTASSWGRTLDFGPVIISREYSYASCVPAGVERDITWSTTRLGGPFSSASPNLHKTRRSSSETSRKPSLSQINRRSSSISAAGRKPSVNELGRKHSIVFSTGSRKSSISNTTNRRSSIAELSRKSSLRETKPARSLLSSVSSRKRGSTEEGIPAPTATSSRRPSKQPGLESVVIKRTAGVSPDHRRSSVTTDHEKSQCIQSAIEDSKQSERLHSVESSKAVLETFVEEKSSRLSYKSASRRETGSSISTLAAKMAHDPGHKADASEISRHSIRTQPEKLEDKLTKLTYAEQHSASAISNRTPSKLSRKQTEQSHTNICNESGAEEGVTDLEQLEVNQCSLSTAQPGQKDDEASYVRDDGEDGEDGEGEGNEDAVAGEEAETPVLFPPPDKGREYDPKEAEKTLEDLMCTTQSLYPESRVVIALGLLCILWVAAIIILSTVGHNIATSHPTEMSEPVPVPTATGTSSTFHPRPPETQETHSAVISSASPMGTTYWCSTPYCEREGAYIKSLLNTDVSPCENFYDYVCDAWMARAGPNIGMELGAAVSRDTILEENIENEVIEYLRSASSDVLPAVQLHQACIESTQHESTEVKMALKEMFKELPGETWPVPRTETRFTAPDVWLMAGKLYREFGIDAFLGITIGTHQNEQPLVILELPQTFFFKDYETESRTNDMFREAITEAAVGLSMLDAVDEVTDDVHTTFRNLAQRQSADSAFNFKIVTPDGIPNGVLTFLQVIFDGVAPETIVVRSPYYILTQLESHVKVSDVPSIINYLGFRMIVRMAPFFPTSGFESLKLVYSLETTGRVRTLPLSNSALCLRAVAAALPVCVLKAHARVHTKSGNDLNNRIWLSQMENSFFRNTARLWWVDEFTYLLIRFRLANTKLARFFPTSLLNADMCNRSITDFGSNVAHIYRRLYEQAMKMRLRQVDRTLAPREIGSPFDMRSRYNWGQQTVYVPIGLINSSVPSNSTLFAFHLSRTAVRLFHSLTPLLRQEPTALGASYNLEYTSRSYGLLDKLLDCLYRDFDSMLQKTRVGFVVDPYDSRYALLAQTVAVSLAFVAFRELLHVERIWEMNFRLRSLPDLSSDQLFFVWYALDNCEKSESTYQLRQYEAWQRLPPNLAVNFPLRHLPQFGEAFHCQPGSGMQPPLYAPTCHILNATSSGGMVL